MKTMNKKVAENVKSSCTTRVPIPLTADEEKELLKLASQEVRSKQAMAGIIYRLGMKTYAKRYQ
jgi:hypothetical protein